MTPLDDDWSWVRDYGAAEDDATPLSADTPEYDDDPELTVLWCWF